MMDALEQARREIDTVDAQLAALFERRMKAVLSVAEYKKAHGLPIFDAAREKVVLDKAEARIGDPALRPYYRDHVQNMMDVAKQYEAEVLGRNRAAYQGVEGAFAHIALRALFPHAEAVSCPTWDEVFDAVEKGDAAHGVVPFENSHAGDVSAVLDLCYNHPGLWVVDVYDLPISQNLLVLPGTQLSDLTRVYSHQQAIAQSETFLKQFGLPATAMPNTAMAAKFVAESGDRTKAAIASVETAALYGAQHQHRRRQHHPLHRPQPRKAYGGQPVLPAVHAGQQARQAGRGHSGHRCQRLRYGVHQEPPAAPRPL